MINDQQIIHLPRNPPPQRGGKRQARLIQGLQGRNAMPIFQRNKVKVFQRIPEQDHGGGCQSAPKPWSRQ
jgi:hypothetical protein